MHSSFCSTFPYVLYLFVLWAHLLTSFALGGCLCFKLLMIKIILTTYFKVFLSHYSKGCHLHITQDRLLQIYIELILGTDNLGFLGGSVIKNPPANAGDMGSMPDPMWEDLTCHGAPKPGRHNTKACIARACAPQQEKPIQHN